MDTGAGLHVSVGAVELASTLVHLAQAAIRACDAETLTRRAIRRHGESLEIEGRRGRRRVTFTVRLPRPAATVALVACGKAAAGQARALGAILGRRVTDGLVVLPDDCPAPDAVSPLRLVRAAHPLPDERSLVAGRAILELARGLGPVDLLVVGLSGGSSALLAAPAPGLTLADEREATRVLLASGASIDELNAVRKHLSAVKGGRLAQATRARVLTLVLSDVLQDPLDVVGSGPTVPDTTTYEDALRVLAAHRVRGFPRAARALLERGAGKPARAPGTPEPSAARWPRSRALVVGGPADLLRAAREEAVARGLEPAKGEVARTSEPVESVAADVLTHLGELSRRARRRGTVQLAAWVREPTVRLTRPGRGGRNTHLALLVARGLRGLRGVAFVSLGSDGVDGTGPAAGAVVDGASWERGHAAGAPGDAALAGFDSGPWAQAAGAALVTGPTGTNLLDLELLAVTPGGGV